MNEIWDIYDVQPIKYSLVNIESISRNLSKAKSIYIHGDGALVKHTLCVIF